MLQKYNIHTQFLDANISNKIIHNSSKFSLAQWHFLSKDWVISLSDIIICFELFLKRRGTMKLILSARFYHVSLSLFSNCININNLNSDSLFVNNREDQQLSTINICLLHCARISSNLPRKIQASRYDKGNCCRAVCHKCFIVTKQYYIKECDIRRQYSNSCYYLSDRKTVYFT